MSTANPVQPAAPATSRASTNAHGGDGHVHSSGGLSNGHMHHAPASAQTGSMNASKKGKGKKTTDPDEASKLIAAKIEQLELDGAKEKDQEAEIGAFDLQVP